MEKAIQQFILIRGLPGSGKSTMAKSLVGFEHFEADMFLSQDGDYKYDPTKLGQAHAWCQEQTRKALQAGKNVVVANTFVTNWEVAPYLKMGVEPQIIICQGRWDSIHGVPLNRIRDMASKFEYLIKR